MATHQFRSYFAYGLLLLPLFTTVCAKKQYNNYYTYDLGTDCTFSKEQDYHLFSDGVISTLKINVPGSIHSQESENCQLTLSTSFDYGTILHIEKVQNLRRPCVDFLEISIYVLGTYKVTEKLCNYIDEPTWNFFSKKGMTLNFHTNLPSATLYDEFKIVATAYKPNCFFSDGEHFMCANGYCIWKGFACDGVNNCGDNSDEDDFGRSQCALPDDDDDFIVPQTIWFEHRTAIIGVSVPLVIISMVCFMIRLCLVCKRVETTTARGTTVRRRIYVRRNNIPRGDPPYSILPNEPGSVPFDPPPPYTTVAISPKNYPCLIQQGTPSQLGTSTLQGTTIPQGTSTLQRTSTPQVTSMPQGTSLQSGIPPQSRTLQSGMLSQSGGPPQQEISSRQLTNAESINRRF